MVPSDRVVHAVLNYSTMFIKLTLTVKFMLISPAQ